MGDIINKQPLVTVGICCYNRIEGFKNTLKYIAGQSYQNLEILISQDFHEAVDLTAIVAAENDNRITFYKQPQQLYMYNNFRFLLERANGKYFMWASDDDWWAPDFIEKIIELMINDPLATAGHSDFVAVNENNIKIAAYPDFLPYITEFSEPNDIKRIRNYINQFETFGKPNLIYSIFKTNALRTKQVINILKDCELWGDMLVVLSVLIKGKLAVHPELLRTCTSENEKTYTQAALTPRVMNLLIVEIDIGGLAHIYRKWSGFIYYHFKIVGQSELSLLKKMAIYTTLIKKTTLFYYDLVSWHTRLRGYNIFSMTRRKHRLN